MRITIDIADDGDMVVIVGGDVHRCTEAHFAMDATGPTMTLTHPLGKRTAIQPEREDKPAASMGYMDGT